MDSKKRSLVKTVSYRFLSIFVTALVAFVFIHQVELSLAIGLSDTISKFGVYYFHERAWNKIKFGKEEPEFNI